MKVDKHISELLYEHNCVIVPNLGGFVANYSPAKIHPTQHTFTPPSKNIVFNKNLNTNDGLLANHIVSVFKTSYPEAIHAISHFVTTTNAQLKKGEKVTIEAVGTLHLDVERNIQFVPATTNYLLDAFGLTQFQSPAIKRDNIGKRIEKEFKDRDAIALEKKNPARVGVKRIAAVAILIPFIFGMIWIPLKTDLLKNVNYSNLNPFASKETTKVVLVKKAPAPKVKSTPIVSLPVNNDTVNTSINTVVTAVQPVTTIVTETKTTADVKPDNTRVTVNNSLETGDLKFHLITGCFQIEENAINFTASLNRQNIPASIIGKRNGLFVVSCGDYSTRKDALQNLDQLKISQPNAWLLKN